MKFPAFSRVCLLLVAFGLELAAGPAAGQAFPSRPVRIIVPFPAGGSGDIIARTVAQPVARALGHNVVVDNRPGGTGLIGAERVARSQLRRKLATTFRRPLSTDGARFLAGDVLCAWIAAAERNSSGDFYL